jgi:hypothetical protein
MELPTQKGDIYLDSHPSRYIWLKPGADDGFLSGEIENIVFTLIKIR